MLDIESFDLGEKCETPFEFELLDKFGKGTGGFISVYGDDAPLVKSFVYKYSNNLRIQEAANERLGKKSKVRTIEEDISASNELVAIRVASWRGFKQECTFDNAVRLVSLNSLAREQILAASGDLANFTKG
jgi:hypothetical protein